MKTGIKTYAEYEGTLKEHLWAGRTSGRRST